MKITIPMIPPSLNKFAGRNNVWEYRSLKQQWKDMICLLCTPKPQRAIDKAVVTITYYFANKIRRDPDNYNGKLIMDGLTEAGLIKDDSFDCIELRLVGKYDKENPRTEIEITDCGKRIVEILGGAE